MAKPKGPILVTGGSGRLAQLVVSELLARGLPPEQLIVTTRNPGILAELAARGAQVRHADHERPDTLVDAFRGAERMLLISGPPKAFLAGTRLMQHKAAIEAATIAGVPHIFYTSGAHAATDNMADAHVEHWQSEEALRGSGATWTVLRHWEWPDYHAAYHWQPAVESGVLYSGVGDGLISHVTREDCAAADAGALLAEDADNRIFNINGPHDISAEDLRRALEGATGKRIELRMVEPADLAGRLIENGTDTRIAPIFAMVADAIRNGWYAGVGDDQQRLAGRPGTSLSEWLQARMPGMLASPPEPLWD